MARVTKRVLGNIQGTIGDTTFSKRGNKTFAKSTPKPRKKRSKAEALSEQNLRIKLISRIQRDLTDVLKIGFKVKGNPNSPYNRAAKCNINAAIKGEYPNLEIDYTRFKISDGAREIAWAPKLTFEAERNINLSWEIPEICEMNTIGDDRAVVVIYYPDAGLVYDITKPRYNTIRRALCYRIKVTKVAGDQLIHVWMFFISPDGKELSNSRYFGSGYLMD